MRSDDMISGTVFEIQHFSLQDGPGIRTTVFLKGCPLHCLWCHNPESQASQPEILFLPEKCIACRACEAACARGCHSFTLTPGGAWLHTYHRDDCLACGACAGVCFAGALERCGREMTVAEVIGKVLADSAFYRTSGGGLTLSGGEPLQQFEFSRALLSAAKTAGLHTVIETCGCAPRERLLELVPLVDLFYYDVKETDDERHRAWTGAGNRLLLDNLRAIDEQGAALLLRCPVIPGLNDRADHFSAVARLAGSLRGAQAVHILPYHPLGSHKQARLGKPSPFDPPAPPTDDQAHEWIAAVQRETRVTVQRG